MLPLLAPVLAVVSVFALAFAWAIPALYAARGAGVLRPRGGERIASDERRGSAPWACSATSSATRRASSSRAPGWWSSAAGSACGWSGPAGALLVRPGGRRVQCYCVRVADADLPAADRVAHLLLALRADESGLCHRGQPHLQRGVLAAAPAAVACGA